MYNGRRVNTPWSDQGRVKNVDTICRGDPRRRLQSHQNRPSPQHLIQRLVARHLPEEPPRTRPMRAGV
jgi:hypothetical protein